GWGGGRGGGGEQAKREGGGRRSTAPSRSPEHGVFGTAGADKRAGVTWSPSSSGAPVLAGVLTWVGCEVEAANEAGGGTMLNPVAMSIVATTFPAPAQRARAIGVVCAGFRFAAGVGPGPRGAP